MHDAEEFHGSALNHLCKKKNIPFALFPSTDFVDWEREYEDYKKMIKQDEADIW